MTKWRRKELYSNYVQGTFCFTVYLALELALQAFYLFVSSIRFLFICCLLSSSLLPILTLRMSRGQLKLLCDLDNLKNVMWQWFLYCHLRKANKLWHHNELLPETTFVFLRLFCIFGPSCLDPDLHWLLLQISSKLKSDCPSILLESLVIPSNIIFVFSS